MSKILYRPKTVFLIKYGALYNWFAATDIRNIANDDWHLSTKADIDVFQDFYNPGGGGKLKEVGFIRWDSPNTGATNEYGFNARGAGIREINGTYALLHSETRYWTEHYTSITTVTLRTLTYLSASMGGGGHDAKKGVSLRLVKNSTTLLDGQTGIYIGNDGKMYRTICIGTQEWLADNLAETKFRTGELIPIVTDNSAWAALTTAGMCYYNNDINNR